ncbi:cell wall-binding repeat-containing protein [Planococcus sp. ISL-109]|uniref:cell wall-binding repeat-containing protein n=1 Tax=Planococcus sp. ISL-109 TaxID=2819166 RepID=UPI001BEC34AF|nr:cell wall-binding repeat-containing protein [Planococcus sp. ISL-109]MBT2583959.1 cell wall-binding repeat-containing protein [Planococcus sp. ISL-109]
MKRIKNEMGLALLIAASGAGVLSFDVAAANAEYQELVKLPNGLVASNLMIHEKQIVAVLESRFEAEAVIGYGLDGEELWRKQLSGAQYAIGEQAFVVVSGNKVAVHSLEDGEETGTFSLADEFRMSGSGASVTIESGHLLITGNLGSRLWVHKLDGTLAADVSGGNIHQAAISSGHLVYLDGSVLHGRLLAGGKEWRSPGVLEPYVLGEDGIIYYLEAQTEEVESLVLVARSLVREQTLYEKALPAEDEVKLSGVDDNGVIAEMAASAEWAFFDEQGDERMRKPLRSAAFQAMEQRYRPVITQYELGFEQQQDHQLLMLREQGTSALGNPYQLGSLQVLTDEGGFQKVLEHSVEAATLYPSGAAAVLGAEQLKFYDSEGNQTMVETVPDGSGELLQQDGAVYVFGGSGIAALTEEPEPKSAAVEKISGADVYETAALLSAAVWDSADTVVLATGESFADALSGAPLAYQEGGPLLFTGQGGLNAKTKAEIERLGAENAIILGSKSAISDAQLHELEAIGVRSERIGGANRYATAALVAQRMDSDGAIVADGLTFKDVSTASVFAAQQNYPILLAKGSRMPSETLRAMAGRSDIVLAGDRLTLKSRLAAEEPRRLAVLAPASSFTDALSAATAAAKRNGALYLVEDGGVTKDLLAQLADYESLIVVDSEGLIDAAAVKALEGACRLSLLRYNRGMTV